MECFLDCFGLKDDNKKKKRRFSGKKSPSQEQERLSYAPRLIWISKKIPRRILINSKKSKKRGTQKIKKRVRFDLNVKARTFQQNDDDDEEDDDLGTYFSEGAKSTITSQNLETSVDRLLIGRKSSGRDRSKYVCSVLNPVENLSQWKALLKAKGVIYTQYMCEKENFLETDPLLYNTVLCRSGTVGLHTYTF